MFITVDGKDVLDFNSFDNCLHAYILAIYTDIQKKCSFSGELGGGGDDDTFRMKMNCE